MKYYSANQYYRQTFGGKVYRLALYSGMSCPNRDGTLGTRGCIFCSASGSGEFAEPFTGNCEEALNKAIQRVESKAKTNKFISYFQSFSNTYAPPEQLRRLFFSALDDPRIVALSVATRPDLLGDDVLRVLEDVRAVKPLYIELGLQTIHPQTAAYIRRGYDLSCYDRAVTALHGLTIPVITHQILGLPFETRSMILETAAYIGQSGVHGIKFHALQILRGTDLADEYARGQFHALEQDKYISLLLDCLRRIPDTMVVYRLTGDGAKRDLVAPDWSADKKRVLNEINRRFSSDGCKQGDLFRAK